MTTVMAHLKRKLYRQRLTATTSHHHLEAGAGRDGRDRHQHRERGHVATDLTDEITITVEAADK